MKHAKALLSHMYDGKRRNVGDVYPIRRGDWPLMVKLGRIEIVPNPADSLMSYQAVEYRTTAMEAEPVKVKRKYTRKKVVEETKQDAEE